MYITCNKWFVFLLACLLCFQLSAFALPSDRAQPIKIESNRAHRDERRGLTIYEGDVVIIQGTIRIEADKVQIFDRNSRANKIICLGNPARYQQQTSTRDSLIIARANRIEYAINEEIVTLLQEASIEQNGGTITGENINYNLKTEIVNAQGSQTGKQRIQMIIPPQKLDKPEDETEQP